MEILKSEIGLGSEESVTQKFAKQICMLLKAIQCKLDSGFFSDWSLDKYVDKIIKASDEDLEDSFMNNEGSSQSGRDNIHSNIKSHHRGQRRKDVPGSSKKNYLKKETRECREAKKVVEAQKRRERARRFSSFTSWMPDLCRVWAPKQAKNSRDKADQQKRMAKRKKEERSVEYDTVRHQQGRIYSVRCRGTCPLLNYINYFVRKDHCDICRSNGKGAPNQSPWTWFDALHVSLYCLHFILEKIA